MSAAEDQTALSVISDKPLAEFQLEDGKDYRQAVHHFCGEASTLAKKSRLVHQANLNKIATYWLPQLGDQYAGFNWENCPWHQLREAHVAKIVSLMFDAGRSPNTIRLNLSALKSVAGSCRRLGFMDVEDYLNIREVKAPRGSRAEPGRALSQQEARELLNAAADRYDDLRHRHAVRDPAIIGLMLYNGLRRAEVSGVKIGDFKLEQGKWVLRIIGKGNKERVSPLSARAQQLLRPWFAMRFESFEDHNGQPVSMSNLPQTVKRAPLFVALDRWGNPIDESDERTQEGKRSVGIYATGIDAILSNVASRADIQGKVTPHDLRRTYATALEEKDWSIHDIQKAMGHSDISTTQRYLRGASKVRALNESLDFS